jgi:hypothetical protein
MEVARKGWSSQSFPGAAPLFAEQLALAALAERPQAGSQIGAVDRNLFTA